MNTVSTIMSYPAYIFTARLRFAYLFLLLSSLIFVVMLAYVFSIFFSVLLPSSRAVEGWALRAIFMLPCAPIILIAGAWLLDEVVDVMLDAASPGLMLDFRLRLTAVLHRIRNWRDAEVRVPRSTFLVVDLLTFLGFEVVPLLGFITGSIKSQSITGAIGGYFQFGTYYAFIMALTFCVVDFLTLGFEGKFKESFERLKTQSASPKSLKWNIPAGAEQGVLYYGWTFLPSYCWRRQTRPEDSRNCGKRAYHWLKMKLPFWLRFLMDVLLFILFALLISFNVIDFGLGWMLLCAVTFLIAIKLREKFPNVLGVTFMTVQTFFTIFAALLFLFGSAKLTPSSSYTPMPPLPGNEGIRLTSSDALVGSYFVCQRTWMGLDVVDLGILSNIAYASSDENLEELMHQAFNGTALADWEQVYHPPHHDPIFFTEIYFPSTNLTVVTVRGTSTAVEIYEDANIYSSISTFQLINMFVPVLTVLPDEFMRSVMDSVALKGLSAPPIYTKALHHVEMLAAQGKNVVVTGHSLGGAIAGLIAAKVSVPAVTFSPPGLFYQSKRMNLQMEDLRKHVVAVVPDLDVVPQADMQVGSVQMIQCLASVVGCHSIDNTICTLIDSCGNRRKRELGSYCSPPKD